MGQSDMSGLCGLPRGARILYLDDQETLVRLAMRTLEGLGYHCTGYCDAQEALNALRAAPDAYDLVFTDLNLGVISGLDVVREVRALKPSLPVIVVSAYLTAEAESMARSAGAFRVLMKAATFDDLIGELLNDEDPMAQEHQLIEHTAVAGRSLNVLVVQDDPAVRRYLCEVLSMDGHRTTEAEDGAAALRSLAASRPHVIIADLLLPGNADLKNLREHTNARIIAIAGMATGSTVPTAKSLGVDAVLAKPVGATEILDAVAAIAAG